MKNNRASRIAAAIVATLTMAAIFPAWSQTPADTRRVIELAAPEQEHVMQEMRQFLVSIHLLMDAVLRDDFKAAADAARTSGRTEPAGMEKSIAQKLPPEFRKLAFDTHARFDQIAVIAEKSDRTQVLKATTGLLGNCVACHAAYAIRVK